MNPVTRTSGFVLREIGDEVVVYDPVSHRAHCLNRTAAAVFRAWDGTRAVAAVAARLTAELGAPVPVSLVEEALDQLRDAGLLDPSGSVPAPAHVSPSRREVVRRAAQGAAIMASVVTSLVVPAPAEAAASACVPAASCTGNDGVACKASGGTSDCVLCTCQSGVCADIGGTPCP